MGQRGMQAVLETDRLRLRRLAPEDLASIGAMLDDAEVIRYFASKETQLAATQRWIQVYDAQGFGMLGVERKDTGELIGRCGFVMQEVEEREEVELGWLITRAHWNRGYATEAALALLRHGFSWHRFSRIISLIDPANATSIAVARKLDMTHVRDVFKFNKTVHLFARTCPKMGRTGACADG